jgi:hypothetical protein
MKKALRTSQRSVAKVVARCEQEVTKKEYDCAMSAPNPDKWEECIQ